ncbi:MAG: OmpA family protein, partial [Pseudomonadota bacterium]|nr:OmpA family protein [Pseudomonadota bacterium]
MKKLNKVASLFATAALASSFTGVSAQTVDNWVSGTGLPWKNGTNELCWRDGFWTPATALAGCDGAPVAPAAPAPAPAPSPAPA